MAGFLVFPYIFWAVGAMVYFSEHLGRNGVHGCILRLFFRFISIHLASLLSVAVYFFFTLILHSTRFVSLPTYFTYYNCRRSFIMYIF
jgi:hypothetical protein